jgi:hypothetical protein
VGRHKNYVPVKGDLTTPEWERQPKESGEMYNLFAQYLALGHKRSLSALLRANGVTEKDFDMMMNRIHVTSTKWFWQFRKDKYEEHIARMALDDDILNRKEMIKRLSKHARATETALIIPVQKFLEKLSQDPNALGDVKIQDLFDMVVDAAAKLTSIGEFERKLRGEPTEIIRQEGGTHNVNINTNVDSLNHEELLKKAKELGFVRK